MCRVCPAPSPLRERVGVREGARPLGSAVYPVFDAYVMVDWSAASVPAAGADSIWIASAERRDGALPPVIWKTRDPRRAASALLADRLSDLVARDRVTLVGFDFAFGYPRRLRPPTAWRWGRLARRLEEIAARARDGDDNANNRFEVAAALNQRISGGPFPFWGCPARAAGPLLSPRKPAGFDETRRTSPLRPRRRRSASGVEAGLSRLRRQPDPARHRPPARAAASSVAGRGRPHLAVRDGAAALERPGTGDWRVLFAEIYPSIFDSRAIAHQVKDARQVQAVVEHVSRLDETGRAGGVVRRASGSDSGATPAIETEEAWILGIGTAGGSRFAKPRRDYDYIRDPDEIYRRSFAIIRAEADLRVLPADLEAAGRAADPCHGRSPHHRRPGLERRGRRRGRQALASGATILVDTEMVAAGIIRNRLPADNSVICTLAEPGVGEAARAAGTTRSAAAVDCWRDRLAGAVVAIGNAPTALFRLLELIDEGAPRPAVILGFPWVSSAPRNRRKR